MLTFDRMFQSGMVLQRQKPVAVWGKADPGAKILISIQGKSAEAVADADGAWMTTLPSLEASEQETLLAKSGDMELALTDVAVGEVWIAGGQSNMEFPICYEKHWAREKDTRDQNLRFYDVPEVCYDGQEKDFDYSKMGVWRKADSEDDLKYFSAVAYYFQKEIAADQKVPVGIVGCNWGGTRSCVWMRKETVERVGKPWMDLFAKDTAGVDMEEFWEKQHTNPMNDKGNVNMDPMNAFILSGTPTMEEIVEMIKTAMAQQASQAGAENGADVPQMSFEEGMAKYANELQPTVFPGCLYEHMVKKTAPFTARGVLWYQGESDDVPGLQSLYKDMLTGLIGDWRDIWKDAKLPFYVVQLPGYDSWMMQSSLDFPAIRRCQEEVADSVEDVYLCSISDVGEEKDIHPKDKKTVGHRLALLARKYTYGEELLADAPVLKKAERNGEKIVLTFANAGEGLRIAGDQVAALSITKEKEEIPFTAEAEGSCLVLTPDTLPEDSVKVDLAQTGWYQINLYNSADIPAIPFSVRC